MWAIAKIVLGFVGGPILGAVENMLGKYMDHKSLKVREGAAVYKAELEAQRAAHLANKQLILAEQGAWYTRLVRPALAFPLILHFGAISWVSTFPQWGWDVHVLPAPMNEWEGIIILSYFMARPVEKIGSKVANRLLK